MIHGTLMVSISFIPAFIQDQRKQQGVNEAASKRTIEKLNTILGLHNFFLNWAAQDLLFLIQLEMFKEFPDDFLF